MSSGSCSRPLMGWLAGCGAATAVMSGLGLVALAIASGRDLTRFLEGGLALLFFALIDFVVIGVLTAAPAGLVIWLSERLAIRSVLFFSFVGAGIGVASISLLMGVNGSWNPVISLLFGVAGFAAGVAYWRVAGRHAGSRDRARPVVDHAVATPRKPG